MNNELECCVVTCDLPLDKTYWDNQYQANTTGWDLGEASPPLVNYFKTIDDKAASILIPGCGNAYEVEALLALGFTNITVIDIAPTVVSDLQQKLSNTTVKIICGDFFEHAITYNYIFEQTFFCALPPTLRQQYVHKMFQLLKPNGKLVGLLFNRQFDKNPPFGGSKEEYNSLFKDAFTFKQFDECNTSVTPRLGTELFIEFEKNAQYNTYLFAFNGITCNGCKNTITQKFLALPNIVNASISTDFKTVLVVCKGDVDVNALQQAIAYDEKYSIKLIS